MACDDCDRWSSEDQRAAPGLSEVQTTQTPPTQEEEQKVTHTQNADSVKGDITHSLMSLPVLLQAQRGGGGQGEAEALLCLRSGGRCWDPGSAGGGSDGGSGLLAP